MATTIEANTKKLLSLENQFWQALKDGDVDTAVSLTDFPCIVTGPQGVGRVDKETFTAMMTGSKDKYTLESYELERDPKVRMVSDDIAIVAYRVHEKFIVDGKPVEMDAADSSTWIRRDDQWRCVQHSESIVGDPFGRDRRNNR